MGHDATAATARVEAGRAALSGSNEVLGVLALLGVIAVGRSADVPLGGAGLLSFSAIFFLAYRPLRDLADAGSHAERGAAAAEALDRLAPSAVSADADRTATALVAVSGRQSVGDGALVLESFGAAARGPRVSARIAARTLVCLWGPTGSGKTTLLRALLGLETGCGRLRFGDGDLARAGVGPHRRPFAWVPQDAPIITGTLAANVALAARSTEHAASALALVGAADLVGTVGNDLVGPGGRPLSGGQRRLLCLARAIATGSPVLLLDEPTEGLDAAAASRVVTAMRLIAQERTVIVATHNQAVADLADVRVELDERPPSASTPTQLIARESELREETRIVFEQ
jgi:ABC-type transport system involved in cytochrome bd biosynthesis fused ATPase/permease subunit